MPAAKSLTPPRSPDALPPDLRALWLTLPPKLKLKEGLKVRQISRGRMYQRIKSGHIIASKDGSATLLDTLSILLDLASLPAFADAKAIAPHLRGNAATTSDDTAVPPRPRRGRRRKAAPNVASTASSTTS